MSKNCTIDLSDLERRLDNLNEENRKNALFNSINKGGQELVKDTQRELLRVLPNAGKGEKYAKPMTKGIRLKKDKAYDEVKVHIMGDYRLKFFEMGTKERYLKKPLSSKDSNYQYKSGSINSGGTPFRGRIKAKHFFESARENSNMPETIMNSLTKEIDKLLG